MDKLGDAGEKGKKVTVFCHVKKADKFKINIFRYLDKRIQITGVEIKTNGKNFIKGEKNRDLD